MINIGRYESSPGANDGEETDCNIHGSLEVFKDLKVGSNFTVGGDSVFIGQTTQIGDITFETGTTGGEIRVHTLLDVNVGEKADNVINIGRYESSPGANDAEETDCNIHGSLEVFKSIKVHNNLDVGGSFRVEGQSTFIGKVEFDNSVETDGVMKVDVLKHTDNDSDSTIEIGTSSVDTNLKIIGELSVAKDTTLSGDVVMTDSSKTMTVGGILDTTSAKIKIPIDAATNDGFTTLNLNSHGGLFFKYDTNNETVTQFIQTATSPNPKFFFLSTSHSQNSMSTS